MTAHGVERSDYVLDGDEVMPMPQCTGPAALGCHQGKAGRLSGIAQDSGRRTAGLFGAA